MLKEKLWNVEMRELLQSQIKYLKSEIIVKNTIIEQLISELSYRNQSGIDNNNNNNNNRSRETLSINATLNDTNNASDVSGGSSTKS